MNLTRGIDLKKVAERMNGCSGAELKGVCTEAGMYALRERRIHVTQEDFGLCLPSSPAFILSLPCFLAIFPLCKQDSDKESNFNFFFFHRPCYSQDIEQAR